MRTELQMLKSQDNHCQLLKKYNTPYSTARPVISIIHEQNSYTVLKPAGFGFYTAESSVCACFYLF